MLVETPTAITARPRPDLTGWRRDHGRRAIHRMCLARRADKIEARDATLPAVVAYREAQRRLREREAFVAWRFRFGVMWARIAYAATFGEAA